MKLIHLIAIALVFSVGMMGCSSSNTVKGGAIGAGVGAVIGGVIGNQTGNTAVGAIIGAAVGGTAGALIGNYMDEQAEELQNNIKDSQVRTRRGRHQDHIQLRRPVPVQPGRSPAGGENQH
jgi:uncharacterized protein YcfJ